MTKVVIVYFSVTGTTARLAEAVQTGAAEAADASQHLIVPADIIDGRFRNEAILSRVDAADGIAFGSPTYMGGPAAQFKAFADATSDRWSQQLWRNKVAADFTSGSCANGDQGHTLTYFTILAAQHGMVRCGLDIPGGCDPVGRNRVGSQLGLATHGVGGRLDPSDIATARYLGKRLATAASRFGAPTPQR